MTAKHSNTTGIKDIIVLLVLCIIIPALTSCHTPSKNKKIHSVKQKLQESSRNYSDGFMFPVGPPYARGYYNAQKFGEKNNAFGGNYHLGEDWNGIRGGNTDLGDPVYAAANGVVTRVEHNYPGWGNVVLIAHHIYGQTPRFIESLYGHLHEVFVSDGDFIKRGTKIGTIGNAEGLYYAHLHFEIRSRITLDIGDGYAPELKGFLSPTGYIKKNHYLK